MRTTGIRYTYRIPAYTVNRWFFLWKFTVGKNFQVPVRRRFVRPRFTLAWTPLLYLYHTLAGRPSNSGTSRLEAAAAAAEGSRVCTCEHFAIIIIIPRQLRRRRHRHRCRRYHRRHHRRRGLRATAVVHPSGVVARRPLTRQSPGESGQTQMSVRVRKSNILRSSELFVSVVAACLNFFFTAAARLRNTKKYNYIFVHKQLCVHFCPYVYFFTRYYPGSYLVDFFLRQLLPAIQIARAKETKRF